MQIAEGHAHSRGPCIAEGVEATVVLRRLRSDVVVRYRLAVLFAGLAALAVKVFTAANTFGTTDVQLWGQFADSVRENGPVGIYGHQFLLVYNHPPLSGWLLLLIDWTIDHVGGNLPLLVR